jgi:hypothetical protein
VFARYAELSVEGVSVWSERTVFLPRGNRVLMHVHDGRVLNVCSHELLLQDSILEDIILTALDFAGGGRNLGVWARALTACVLHCVAD